MSKKQFLKRYSDVLKPQDEKPLDDIQEQENFEEGEYIDTLKHYTCS